MGNPNNSQSSDFQSLLYYKFTFKKEYDKNEVAVFLNKAPDTFQRYCSGRLSIPVDSVRDLIKFISKKNPRDTELLEFFCIPANYLPIPLVEVKPSRKNIKLKEIKLSILNGNALAVIEKAYEDGKIDKNEWKEIHKKLINLREIAAEIDEQIRNEIKP